MKKKFFMVSATLVLSLGTVFGIMSYNSTNTSSLITSNLEALSSGDPGDTSLKMVDCPNDDNPSFCAASCPDCKKMWDSTWRGSGARMVGTCDTPGCGHKF